MKHVIVQDPTTVLAGLLLLADQDLDQLQVLGVADLGPGHVPAMDGVEVNHKLHQPQLKVSKDIVKFQGTIDIIKKQTITIKILYR